MPAMWAENTSWLLRAGHRDRLFQSDWNVAMFTGFCMSVTAL